MDDKSVLATDAADRPIRGVTTSRRSLLGTAVGLTGAALATSAWRPMTEPAYASAEGRRDSSSTFAIELDGTSMGLARSVEGGVITAEVFGNTIGYYQKKHVTGVKIEDFVLEVDLSLHESMYQWINSSWTGTFARRTGAVIDGDSTGKATRRREFSDALITEVTIPACDASAKEAGSLTVKIAMEQLRYQPVSGDLKGTIGPKQKMAWMPSNFRFEVPGVNASRVSKVDSFTVKVAVTEDAIGHIREFEKLPTNVGFGDLVLTMSESGVADWVNWHDDFVIKGNSQDEKEKPALLSFLTADLKDVLAHIHFFNMGIYRLADAPADGSPIKKVQAHLYYERAEFHIGPVETSVGDGPVFCAKCADGPGSRP